MNAKRLAGGLPRLLLGLGSLILLAGAPPDRARPAAPDPRPVASRADAPPLAPPAEADTARSADTARCVDARTLDLRRILPPPPSAGSSRERSELDELLRIQSARTPRQAARARQDATISVFRFADALGNPPGFTAARLPRTLALFRHLSADEIAVLDPAKREFARPRPFSVEPRLAPVTERPPSMSYPSGHSLWAYTTALVLADMVPERRARILARADQYAHDRSVAGVHYPSDVEAGRLAGTALAAMVFTCPAFQREEAGARRELRGVLGLPQAAGPD